MTVVCLKAAKGADVAVVTSFGGRFEGTEVTSESERRMD